MMPSRITMVPRSIAGLAIGKIFALVIATTPRVAVVGRAEFAACGSATALAERSPRAGRLCARSFED
jgi:hypothetical protein